MVNNKEFDKSTPISLGHSPDPDDAFMFFAMAAEKIDLKGYKFIHQLEDIQTLNKRCLSNQLDISAVSFHTYPYISKNYQILKCGASMGDGYGPMIVYSNKKDYQSNNSDKIKDHIINSKIAIPGEQTSAFLALKLFLSESNSNFSYDNINYKVVEFDKIFDAINSNEVDFGLIIHEGQINYLDNDMKCLVDLGKWWKDKYDLPLPLGCNVINKRIPLENRIEIEKIVEKSILYSLKQENRKEALDASLNYSRGLKDAENDKFVSMYVNDYTIDLGEKGRKSVKLFLDLAYKNEIIPFKVNI